MGVAGKVALVTGGANGLGRAVVAVLAERGARVVVADLDAAAGERVAGEVGGAFVATDVADLESNRAAVAVCVERFGGLDLVHLNAGVASGCGVGDDFDLALYRRAMGANLDGVVFGTHAALPALRARGGGAIVATASLAGLTSVPYDPLYAANKHAVVGLARSLGLGLGDEGIRFNAVCPGFSDSAHHRPDPGGAGGLGRPHHPGGGRGRRRPAPLHRRRVRRVLVRAGRPRAGGVPVPRRAGRALGATRGV